MNLVDHLEQWAQQFIEGSFQRLFRKQLHPADLVDQLATTIEMFHQNGTLLPSCYQIRVNPTDYAALVNSPGDDAVVAEMQNFLATFIKDADIDFADSLQVVLNSDTLVRRGQIQVDVLDRDCP